MREASVISRAAAVPDAGARPRLVLLAVVKLFVASLVLASVAVGEWAGASNLAPTDVAFQASGEPWWPLVDVAIAALAFWGAVRLLHRHRSGQLLGYLFAAVAMLRWGASVSSRPLIAIPLLAANVAVICALVATRPWFTGQPVKAS